jgi:putative hydrolase of the HAD superfamily
MGRVTGLTDDATAVIFDFFGTLTPLFPSQSWAGNAAKIAAAMGVPATALGDALNESYAERITGVLGGIRDTFAVLANRLGVQLTDAQLDEVSRIRREVQEAMFTFRPEVEPVLTELRARGLKIGLLSDCTSELPDTWSRLPVAALVDAAVFSCAEGTRKPDPRLFLTVAANLPADPARCVYVGDGGGRELTGASAVGMRAVLLAGPDWHIDTARDAEVGWGGTRIGSLTELVT